MKTLQDRIVQYNQDNLDNIAMDKGDWCSLVATTTSGVYNTGEVIIDSEIQKIGLKMTADKVLSNPWGAKTSTTVKYITRAFKWKYEKIAVDSERFWQLLQDGYMLTIGHKQSNAYGIDRRDNGVINSIQKEGDKSHLTSVVFDSGKYYIVDNYKKDLPKEYQQRFGNVYINDRFVDYVKAGRYSACYLITKEHEHNYWQRLIAGIVARKGYNRFNDRSKQIIDRYL